MTAPTLEIITTRYRRGAVIKLARDHTHIALAKFIVETRHGVVELFDATGARLSAGRQYTTIEQAIELAVRECERIRKDLFEGCHDQPC